MLIMYKIISKPHASKDNWTLTFAEELPCHERTCSKYLQFQFLLWELYAKENPIGVPDSLREKGGWQDKARFPLCPVWPGWGKMPELMWMYLEWIFLMISQVQRNCQTWALIISWFLVPEPIKMIYRPQRMESGQGAVKGGAGESELPSE